MNSATVLALATCVLACGGRQRAIVHHDLGLLDARARPQLVSAGGPAIAVGPFSAASPYDSDQIAVRMAPLQLEYFRYHAWISPIPDLVAERLAAIWRRSGRFAAVESPDEMAPSVEIVVTGRIERLEVDNTSSTSPFAHVVIVLTASSPSGAIVSRDEFARRVQAADRSIESLIEAIRRAVDDIADASASELEMAAPIRSHHGSSRL